MDKPGLLWGSRFRSGPSAVAARAGYGGTAPLRVAEQLSRLCQTLAEQRGGAAWYGGPRRP